MTTVREYLEENKRYINADDAASISQIADEQWPAVLEALDELNRATEPGIDCGVAITYQPLSDFDYSMRNHWTECKRRSEHTFGGFKAIKYEGVQVRKGGQRADQIIVDLGEKRVCLS